MNSPPSTGSTSPLDGQDDDLGLDLVQAPPEQPRIAWGDIVALPTPGSGGEPRLEARVTMFKDRSRFFVAYPSGKEEVLSSIQFVAFILELKRSRRFTFERRGT